MFIAIWKTFPPVNHKVLCKNTHTCQHGGFWCVQSSCVCVCFASGFRLCKSWASQPGGQTRKQMDLFGLNPSHATSSSGPRQTCTSLCRAEGRERSSWLWVCMEFWGMGCTLMLIPASKEDGHKSERKERLCLCRLLVTQFVCHELC